MNDERKANFWTTTAGLVTAFAALLTAVTGFIALWVTREPPPSPATTSAAPPPSDGGASTQDPIQPHTRIPGLTIQSPTDPSAEPFIAVSSDSGAVTVEVPSRWSDIDGSFTFQDVAGDVWEGVRASSDLPPNPSASWGAAGVQVYASPTAAEHYRPQSFISEFERFVHTDECQLSKSGTYSDPEYRGVYDLYTACGPEQHGMVVISAGSVRSAHMVALVAMLATSADDDAMWRVLSTFRANY